MNNPDYIPTSVSLVDEGLCTNCTHRDVCRHKDEYIEVRAAVDKLLENKSWAASANVRCKHHSGVTYGIR